MLVLNFLWVMYIIVVVIMVFFMLVVVIVVVVLFVMIFMRFLVLGLCNRIALLDTLNHLVEARK